MESEVGFFRDNLNESIFKKIFDETHTMGKKNNSEDQMESVGGSCDYAFSSSSSDTALGLGSYCVDGHIK